MRLPGLGGWAEDPLWASMYDWAVEHPRAGGLFWALAQSDLRLLYAAAAEIGRQPAGTRILDVPCGGGVAVRALRPGQGTAYVASDIAQAMLDRTSRLATRLGVDDQVDVRIADVGALPFDDDAFDLVVSFTGLHCFPDPELAVAEMSRVLAAGGVLTGSAITNDSGLRFEPIRRGGRIRGLLGPGCTSHQLRGWLARGGLTGVELRRSGPVDYFRAVKQA